LIKIKKILLEHQISIIMISEGLCETQDWSDDAEKFSFAITGINYLLKFK